MKELKLFGDPECWKFKEEHPEEFKSFGCGPGGFGDFLVPDTVWGLNITDACRNHDWGYRFAHDCSEEGRARHDRILRNNGIKIVRFHTKNWLLRKLRLRRVQTYYTMVRSFGGPAYWEERNEKDQVQNILNKG